MRKNSCHDVALRFKTGCYRVHMPSESRPGLHGGRERGTSWKAQESSMISSEDVDQSETANKAQLLPSFALAEAARSQ